MPICHFCKQDLSIDNFVKNRAWKNGCRPNCKSCESYFRQFQKQVSINSPQENINLFMSMYYERENLELRQFATLFGCPIDRLVDLLKLYNIQRCYSCLKIKLLSEFNNMTSTKLGKMHICRECSSKVQKSESSKETKRRYVENNQEKLKEYYREHYLEYKSRMPPLTDAKREHKNRVSAAYRKNRRQIDPIFKLNSAIGSAIYNTLKSKNITKDNYHWENLVGYTLDELMDHLESLFEPGMSWDNYGQWHIDHIIPKASFDIDSIECDEFKRCWALSNLQPLWAADNIAKSNNIGPEWGNG